MWWLVLPRPDYDPTIPPQGQRHLSISLAIPCKLRNPVVRIRLGSCPMNGAAMPEASVDENRYPDSTENKVWTDPNVPRNNWMVPAIAQAMAMEDRAYF